MLKCRAGGIKMKSKSTEKSKYPLYLNAFINALEEYKENLDQNQKADPTKIIFYGVKLINSMPEPEDREGVLNDFQLATAITDCIAELTPREFTNVFPINKDFKGHKYELKDYFYTRDYLDGLEMDEPIGDKVFEFLWEYHNWDITHFVLNKIGYMSDLRQYDGHLSMMEEFMASQGMATANTFKNSKGEVLYVRNGKLEVLKKMKHKFLKLIK